MTEFYTSGLKFSCKRCSTCCRYESGFVYLSEKDIEKLLAVFKMGKNEFIDSYCRWVIGLDGNMILSLKEKPDNDCILWDSSCIVYENRPLQCRTFPFWKSIISSKAAWETAAADCPGMNSGTLHSQEAINLFLSMRESEPVIRKEI